MKRYILWVSVFFLAACSSRGCGGDKVVVKYRGKQVLQEQGIVKREGVALGFIATVLQGEGMQRVIVRIPDAGKLTNKDRFVPAAFDNAKLGFEVEPGKGVPLKDGDEVDADPSWSLREKLAQSPVAITLPSGYVIPYPKALTLPLETHDERSLQKFQRSIGRDFKVSDRKPFTGNPEFVTEFEAMGAEVSKLTPAEAHAFMKDRGENLSKRIETASREAYQKGDREEGRHLEQLKRKIEHASGRIEKIARATEKRAARPKRERALPPELRGE